jgi:DNA-binding transcriptional regulator YiaG
MTIAYSLTMVHDGQEYTVDIPNLVVPCCETCGERVFNDQANDQISRAFRARLQLLNPEQIRANRLALGLSSQDLAARLGIAEELLTDWEEALKIQSRAADRMLRLFFASPQARETLTAVSQEPELGTTVVL